MAPSASSGITTVLRRRPTTHRCIRKYFNLLPTNKSHRILVVADAFGKPAYTPRLRFWCEYLVAQGWQVDVYTEQFEPLPFEHSYPIVEIPIFKNRSFDWFIKSTLTFFFDWKSRFFAKEVRKQVGPKSYDIVLACTFPSTPLRAAYGIAKEQRIPLHIDLRDIDEQTPTNQYIAHFKWRLPLFQLFRSLNIRRRNTFIRRADSLSSVSPWHVAFLHQWNKNTHLIYNGYDSSIFVPQKVVTDTFSITYTGRIYDKALQDLSLLFEALHQMHSSCQIPKELVVEWYTDAVGQKRVIHWAQESGTTSLMKFHPFVQTQDIPQILSRSSIVLVASQKSTPKGPHGIMTTKFFEALGVEKPVLCVRSDEECLAQVIKQTNAGLAGTNAQEVADFILDKYAEWKTNGFTHQPVDPDVKRLFTRQYQAQQFEQLLLKAIDERR